MSRRGQAATLIAAMLLVAVAACSSRIAPHDETIAAGLASLQSSNNSFFEQLGRTVGTPEAAWERQTAWYDKTRADIADLRARAVSHGKPDDPTVRNLELLQKCVDELEDTHAGGLTAGQIPILRTLFDSQLRMLIELEAAKRKPAAEEVLP